MPSSTRSHATPTEIVIASKANHAWTPSIFLNPHMTFRTFTHIVCKCEKLKSLLLLRATGSTLVPGSLTLEAGELTAVGAFEFE